MSQAALRETALLAHRLEADRPDLDLHSIGKVGEGDSSLRIPTDASIAASRDSVARSWSPYVKEQLVLSLVAGSVDP